MGQPFMPWQQYVARVANERLGAPDCPACAGLGRVHDCPYAYPVVVVTVPRQSGKTTEIWATGVERCTTVRDHEFWYTAQTGKVARARWDDAVKLVKATPLDRMVRYRRSQGTERISWPNDSFLAIFSPNPDKLHSFTPDTVVLDEAFVHTEEVGDGLMGAIGPGQITLRHRQLWIVSTRGHVNSRFLEDWIRAGRAGSPGVALFDWGAADGVDVFDPDELVKFHPALGLDRNNGITVDAILAQAQSEDGSRKGLSRSEFERAYGNRPIRSLSSAIAPEDWAALSAPQEPPDPRAVTLTYAVAGDGRSATIAAVWTSDTGQPQAKLVRYAPGHSWVAGEVADYAARWRPRQLAAPSNAGTRNVTAALGRMTGKDRPTGLLRNVRQLTSPEYAQAWSGLLEGVRTMGFHHDGAAQLADAAASVVARPNETGSVPSWRLSTGDIGPLVAVMVGLWAQEAKRTGSQLPDLRHAQ